MTREHDTVKDFGIDLVEGVVTSQIHDRSEEVSTFERAPTIEIPTDEYQALIEEQSRED